jgi:hypothetical protein
VTQSFVLGSSLWGPLSLPTDLGSGDAVSRSRPSGVLHSGNPISGGLSCRPLHQPTLDLTTIICGWVRKSIADGACLVYMAPKNYPLAPISDRHHELGAQTESFTIAYGRAEHDNIASGYARRLV